MLFLLDLDALSGLPILRRFVPVGDRAIFDITPGLYAVTFFGADKLNVATGVAANPVTARQPPVGSVGGKLRTE